MCDYDKDMWRAGAAEVYGKPFDEVTAEERKFFKTACFRALHSRRFLGGQTYDFQQSFKRQEEEFARVDGTGEPYAFCDRCNGPVLVSKLITGTWTLHGHSLSTYNAQGKEVTAITCRGSQQMVGSSDVQNAP